jgi:serine/threonine protein kinase
MGKLKTDSGSKYYMAPEVIYGLNKSISDVWSLGCLMYILLSGTLPFNDDENVTVFEKAIEAELKFDGKGWVNVSDEAKDLISKMIDKDFHNRYNATESLNHEWFVYSVSENNTKGFHRQHTLRKKDNFSAFQNKCEIEVNIAKAINKHFDAMQISTLSQKFGSISDGQDLIQSSKFIASLAEEDVKFDRISLESLTDKMNDSGIPSDKIYYKHIMNELRILKEVKKIKQIKMV